MPKSHSSQRGSARTKSPHRTQVEMQLLSLDQWLDPEHRVRIVWQYVETLDLSELYQSIKATVDNVGRDAIDPRILFALWLFATLEGITSARRIDELTRRDIAYLWICGGVSVNHHRLSDFRTQHGELLKQVLTDSIAVLLKEGLITLQTIGQDGMRVRAAAGAGSFRTQEGLEKARQQAQQYVDELEAEDPAASSHRQAAAKERAARERLERIKHAQEELEELQKKYRARTSSVKRSTPRASTTDPEARRMKMGDSGFRPALNVQLASDGDRQLVVAVEVTSQGSDSGLLKPMYDDVCERYGVVPQDYLVDGGFSKQEDITALEQNGTHVYAPLHNEEQQRKKGQDPHAPRPGESAEMTAHRARMGTAEAKEKYRRRSAIAEFPHADCRNRGLTQFRVRGLVKAEAQALWHVLAYNLMRLRKLWCELRGQSYLEVLMAN
jgi:transposase